MHPEIQYRTGGFCEKCYAEGTLASIKRIDDAIKAEVVDQFAALVSRVINANDPVLLERFLGRVMDRFAKPKEVNVHGELKAVHLHAPVDFSR